MPKLRGHRRQKSADNLAAEQRLEEEKAMSEKHKQDEEEERTNGNDDEGREGKRQAKKSAVSGTSVRRKNAAPLKEELLEMLRTVCLGWNHHFSLGQRLKHVNPLGMT